MFDVTAVQPLLQRSVNLFETSANCFREAAMKAHMCGLQGEKRRLRYLSRKARDIVDCTEHKVWDMFKIELTPQEGTVDVSALRDAKSTLEGMIDKMWKIYNEAHQIANDLVVAKARPLSKPVYEYVDCLFEVIGELQRAQFEYELANYEYHHISRYQVSYYNVHDEYEPKEEAQGYSDHHSA